MKVICFVRHLLLQEIRKKLFIIILSAAKIGYKGVPMDQTKYHGGSTVIKNVLYTKFGQARRHEGNQKDKQEALSFNQTSELVRGTLISICSP